MVKSYVTNPETGRQIVVGGPTYNRLSKKRVGSATRGWGDAAPRKGPERRKLYHECGPKCFLLPNPSAPGYSKFPVCRKCQNQHCSCSIDRRGVIAAKIRASQWGYPGVRRKADILINRDIF